MVKNTTGGSKTKSQARKLVGSTISHHLRLSECNLEQYACVTKVYGNGRVAATTVEGLELLCIIRGKMRGRSKRHNVISLGSILLVGLREWEGPDNYKNADVLEVYDAGEVNKLRSIPSTNLSNLDRLTEAYNQKTDNLGFEFSNDADNFNEDEIKPQKLPSATIDSIEESDEINIDDI